MTDLDFKHLIDRIEISPALIKTHHCQTTHNACECVLARMRTLEKVAEAARRVMTITSIVGNPERELDAALKALDAATEKP